MIPMMLGLLLTSISSGQIISRTGRYKVFPIVGSAVFTIGLYLLSLMGRDTTALQSGLSMFVLGAGLGMVMQVLVLAVQNAVEYRDLGVGTSGATFFRTIGSCVGVAVFGTLFTSHLTSTLAAAPPDGAVGPCSPETLSATSATLATCPPAVQDWFLDGVLRRDPHDLPVRRPGRRPRVRPGLAHPRGHAPHRRARPRAGRGVRAAGQPHVVRGAAPAALAGGRPPGPAARVRGRSCRTSTST